MRKIRIYHLLVAVIFLAGCLQQLHVIKLRPDGSGTLEVTAAVTQKMAAMMGKPTDPSPGGELKKLEQEIKQDVPRFGEVTLLSTEIIDTAEHAGVKATYGFKDITKVKLRDRPDPPLPQPSGPSTQQPSDSISFRFATKRDGTKVLTVVTPDSSPDKRMTGQTKTKKTGDRDIAEMKEIMSGMKFAGWIEFGGTVVKTNSPHREGNKVILYEFDFDQILTDPQGFNKLIEANPETLQEAKSSLGNIKGVKMTFEPEIVIEFK